MSCKGHPSLNRTCRHLRLENLLDCLLQGVRSSFLIGQLYLPPKPAIKIQCPCQHMMPIPNTDNSKHPNVKRMLELHFDSIAKIEYRLLPE